MAREIFELAGYSWVDLKRLNRRIGSIWQGTGQKIFAEATKMSAGLA
jgi:hypothetical protein